MTRPAIRCARGAQVLAVVVATLLACAAFAAPAPPAPHLPRAGDRIVGAIRPGFTETVVADSLDSPVSMALAPDGRVLVCEQPGRLRVVRAGRLLARPFVTVPTRAVEEEGLLGVAFDPAFSRTRRVYVLYTALEPTRHNVIAWYRAAGDTAAGEGTIVYEFDTHAAHQHVGGALRFGRDGMLYASSGECGDGSLSQSLASTAGKLLRMRPDGSIPADNPFPTSTRGRHAAIWARGFRNAFSFDIHPRTGRLFVNDIGGSRYEEVDEVKAGDNLGWPMLEGPGRQPKLVDPLYAYTHEHGCAITGGAFYAPARPSFPDAWRDGYFFADYCANEIRWLAPGTPVGEETFGRTLVPGPVDLRVAPDGALWYLARGNSVPTGGPGSGWGIVVRIAPESHGAGGVPAGSEPHHN
jgi:glucose/arabinose dehydrogenase